jgi:transcriptional regulator with XRE-family HTH domain
MKERIIEFLRAENKSSSQFAEEIGVQPSGISHIISGRNKPSLDFIIKMLEKYPYISTEWLLFGRGDMFSSHEMQDLFNESAIEMTEKKSETEKATKLTDIPDSIKALETKLIMNGSHNTQKIVIFYSDGTFREYSPGRE